MAINPFRFNGTRKNSLYTHRQGAKLLVVFDARFLIDTIALILGGTQMQRDNKNIKKLIAALEIFQEIDQSISLPSMLALLHYHDIENNSGNRTIVEERLGMTGATASRATLYWADFKSPREKGQNMVTMVQDPMNRRANIVQYNRKGQEFMAKLSEAIS